MIGLIILLLYVVFALPLIIKSSKLKMRNPPFRLVKKEFVILIVGFAIVTILFLLQIFLQTFFGLRV
jgi:hypothetical protein